MDKETYDLDEILSEVKNRRIQAENNEQATQEAVKSQPEVQPTPDEEVVNEVAEEIENQAPQETTTFDDVITKKEEKINPPQEEPTVVIPNEDATRVIGDISDEIQDDNIVEDNQITEEAPEGMVDLFSLTSDEELAEEPQEEVAPKQKKKKTKKSKILKGIIIALLVIILCVAGAGGIYVYKQLNNIAGAGDDNETVEPWTGMDTLEENYPEITETDASEIASLRDMIKTWYSNGDIASSTHVLNVLLVGEDTRGEDILEEGTRADSAIIVSINVDTGKITLTSILRDAYAYWETTEGDEETGIFAKINGAMSRDNCNIYTYISTIEHLYKIDINNYVIVNFDSFEKIVDAMGGVTLELTTSEINEINNHPTRYANVYIEKTFEGDSGEMLLTGEQALAYCRIRKIDSDNARANRQKTTLTAIFDQAKDESTVTLLKMINALLPYVKTGFSSKDVVSIAKYALTEGWLSYDVETTSVPYSRINESGMGGTYYGEWIWRPDYPADAYYLQTLLYGKSNIILAQNRVDVVKCEKYGFYSEGSAPVTATIWNDAYMETTTYVTSTSSNKDDSDSTEE